MATTNTNRRRITLNGRSCGTHDLTDDGPIIVTIRGRPAVIVSEMENGGSHFDRVLVLRICKNPYQGVWCRSDLGPERSQTLFYSGMSNPASNLTRHLRSAFRKAMTRAPVSLANLERWILGLIERREAECEGQRRGSSSLAVRHDQR